ncbi:Holliday junction branch migration protein RuvA [Halocynthiibacter styelae]|uniref:Holliday junction branch migration complex subunit RuvA n=1 Tax=Halocynthiibacter styelae TaxID=2761955 RepID=A0A8J7ITA8_9RHOB|nr:Holliday junction branch migration protein RuvA [Paenihalocynthiibacter styelae]MBI1492634.1 Holliday junction branch migration protein RuvA [Paenihalocynthiibacter styelae]
MIGRIAGILNYRSTDHVLIDVRGVGYLVYVSDRTMASLPAVGEGCALYTELLVREDNLQLFGFLSLQEKEWHRLLISVQGIGAKASMAILGTLGPDGIGRAIALGDWASVKAAPGVGPKIAQRVVNELKDKAHAVMALGTVDDNLSAPVVDDSVIEDTPATPAKKAAPKKPAKRNTNAAVQADALSALGNLGYAPADATSAVARAAGDNPDAGMSTLIREALKLLAPKD